MQLRDLLYFVRTLVLPGLLVLSPVVATAQYILQNVQIPWDQISTLNKAERYQDAITFGVGWLKMNGHSREINTLPGGMFLWGLGNAYESIGLHGKTLSLRIRTLAIYEHVLGKEHAYTTLALSSLASTYSSLAQYDKALPLQIKVLAINEKTLGPEHPDTAMAAGSLSGTYFSLGMYAKALPLQIRHLSIYEKSLGTDHPNTNLVRLALAGTYRALAQYDKALPLQIAVLAYNENALGPDHLNTALALSSLAGTYQALAQFDKALPLRIRALEINENAKGPEHPDIAGIRIGLAQTYLFLAEMVRLFPEEFSQHDPVLGYNPDTNKFFSAGKIISASDVNEVYAFERDGYFDLDQAELPIGFVPVTASYVRQWKTRKAAELGFPTDHLVAQSSSAVALNRKTTLPQDVRLHYTNKALQLLLSALATYGKVLGSEHPSTARTLSYMGFTMWRLGNHSVAIGLLKQSINIYQSQRERISSIGKFELQSYNASIEDSYQLLASLLTDQGRFAEAQQVLDMLKEEEYFDFIRRSAQADPRRTRAGYTPTEQVWMTRYQAIGNQLAALGAEERALDKAVKLGLTPAQQARQKALQADLAVANKAFTAFLGDMQKDFAAQGPGRAAEAEELSEQTQREMQALIRQLGPDVALLRYFVTKDKVSMILTTPGVVLPFSSTVDSKALNRQIREYSTLLRSPTGNPMPAAQALYQLLLAPVAPALEQAGIKTVMLSPDGNLRHVPFAALHDGTQFAAQRWNLPLYTAVTKDKLRDAPTSQWQAAGLGVTRALGGQPALPAVRGEINSIIQTRAGSSQSRGVVPGEVYLDEAFTAQRLMDVGKRRFELLHVASHFTLSPGTEVNSFLLLGDGQQLTLGDMRTQNYRFDNVDLLTLSACNTGQGGGRDANGKEIEGFGVLAQQQGAKAVLATLWPVADQSTAKLMADMYQRRQTQGLSKIEALRQAQLALMAQPKYAHPFYWAPFILMGNWK